MHKTTQPTHTPSSSDDEGRSDRVFVFGRVIEVGRATIRERPLVAVGGATVFGFVAGSLTPRLIAQPLGVVALKMLLSRVFGDQTPAERPSS